MRPASRLTRALIVVVLLPSAVALLITLVGCSAGKETPAAKPAKASMVPSVLGPAGKAVSSAPEFAPGEWRCTIEAHGDLLPQPPERSRQACELLRYLKNLKDRRAVKLGDGLVPTYALMFFADPLAAGENAHAGGPLKREKSEGGIYYYLKDGIVQLKDEEPFEVTPPVQEAIRHVLEYCDAWQEDAAPKKK